MEGEQCFLRFRTVFEQHVLSRLDLRSLMSLSVTCRGLHCWVCSLPRTFWQVGPATPQPDTMQTLSCLPGPASGVLLPGLLPKHTSLATCRQKYSGTRPTHSGQISVTALCCCRTHKIWEWHQATQQPCIPRPPSWRPCRQRVSSAGASWKGTPRHSSQQSHY